MTKVEKFSEIQKSPIFQVDFNNTQHFFYSQEAPEDQDASEYERDEEYEQSDEERELSAYMDHISDKFLEDQQELRCM